MKQGYVQVYTGDGKGKTTAAIGLAVRAAGNGMRVYIGQFMKTGDYSEIAALGRFPEIVVEQYGVPGWVWAGKVTAEQRAAAAKGFERARQALLEDDFEVVIIDEVNMAVWFGLIEVESVLELIRLKPKEKELVLTGRRAHEQVMEAADLVSEMCEKKHYYVKGVPARKGIEM